jgi:hypothetical protein
VYGFPTGEVRELLTEGIDGVFFPSYTVTHKIICFVPKRDEETGWTELHNEELHNLHS